MASWRFGKRTGQRAGGIGLVRRADAARDAGRFLAAAALYEEALLDLPQRADLHVQAGHMFKEAGVLAAAEKHYTRSLELRPDDPEFLLQLGHFRKTAGQLPEAADAYRRASAQRPGWDVPAAELAGLAELGWVGRPAVTLSPTTLLAEELLPPIEAEDRLLLHHGAVTALTSALVPHPVPELIDIEPEGIHLRWRGLPEQTPWGRLPVLRGIGAVRGVCVSTEVVTEIQITLNGLLVARLAPEAYPLLTFSAGAPLTKFVFNAWLDVSGFLHGPYNLDVRAITTGAQTISADPLTWHTEVVVIAEPLTEADNPDSDTIVDLSPDKTRTPEEWIRSRPSIVRPARRTALRKPQRVLVVRTDQLGDMVAAAPALNRLRALLPEAHIAILVTAANADLAETFPEIDEVLVVDFPDDPVQRRRIMTLADQEALQARLCALRFDLAIDLAPAVESRALLPLTGAPVLVGMGDFPWLTFGVSVQSRDRGDGIDFMPNSAKSLALVEAMNTLFEEGAQVRQRADLDAARLTRFGLERGEFVVLHTGARIAFSRWAHYPALASAILERTGCAVLMLADGPATRASLPASLLDHPRFRLIDERLSFDDLDGLLSFASAFVGNDSGPKHLAALRGTPVVSIHSARINWSEWGQEMTGVIISRRVPCAGCLLYHHIEECGKAYACITDIPLEEVFGALDTLLSSSGLPGQR